MFKVNVDSGEDLFVLFSWFFEVFKWFIGEVDLFFIDEV